MRPLFVLFALLPGCASIFPATAGFSQLNSPPRPVAARAATDVEMVMGQAPKRPYVEYGLIEARTHVTNDQDTDRLLQLIRQEAAHAGCDAVYNLRAHDRPAGQSGVFKGYDATCVVYNDAAPPAPASVSPAATN
jgi:hypothetical protein